jgi:hypothetical protein
VTTAILTAGMLLSLSFSNQALAKLSDGWNKRLYGLWALISMVMFWAVVLGFWKP